eukprot:TRINITY_DN26304_c0_g1_i2.p2 TRINITY_DN26304_c0_g1~~TRINITY_DN26304_c0_g1_i2.p2  ORF type:complete len:104 (+),score=4.59 TRINITY_DN26304_c0_g1_i2:67-378(+)
MSMSPPCTNECHRTRQAALKTTRRALALQQTTDKRKFMPVLLKTASRYRACQPWGSSDLFHEREGAYTHRLCSKLRRPLQVSCRQYQAQLTRRHTTQKPPTLS